MLRKLKKIFLIIHKRVLRTRNQKLCTFLDSVRRIKRVSLLSIWRHRLAVRTQALHACNPGSNPGGVTTLVERVKCDSPSIRWTHLYEIPIHTNE